MSASDSAGVVLQDVRRVTGETLPVVSRILDNITPCPHSWVPRDSIVCVSGFSAFRARVVKHTGVDLPHPGFTLFECSRCPSWGMIDYCGGPTFEITAAAAKALGAETLRA